MKQLDVYAPVKDSTGYSHVARDIIDQLMRRHIRVNLTEFLHWCPLEVQLKSDQHEFLGKALENKTLPSHTPVMNLNVCLPEQTRIFCDKRNTIFTMFEVDDIPRSWVPYLHNVDEILVPTDFNRWSFTNKTGIHPDKVRVLPIGFDPERYNDTNTPLPLTAGGKQILDYTIRFLVVCEISNRKNFWGTLHTFYKVAERVGVDKCCLVLKVGSYSKQMSLEEDVAAFKKQLVTEGTISDLPYAVFNYIPLIPEELHANFIRIGTHYLSTSLGEGWDLSAIQAAACGLHLFVPMHSAYQCWLDQDSVTFLPIAKKMAAFQDNATNRLYQGSNWFAFHMPDSIDIIVDNVLNHVVIEKKKERLKEKIKRFHWTNLMDSYMEALHL
jgi:glycosyltransferase involved in cell wall biosynthesis